MNKYITILLLLVALTVSAQAQQNSGAKSFSLKEAVDYAKQNNYALRNNKLDITSSQKKVNEVLASGLPQVNATGSFLNNVQIPVQVLPNFINDALPPGSPRGPAFINAQFGQKFSATGSITASQVLFDGALLMGVKASREYVTLSRLNVNRGEIETVVSVSRAYYLALLLQTNIALMDTNLYTLGKSQADLEKLSNAGLVEKTDLDRITLQYSSLQLQRDKIKDQHAVALMVLKLQMGMNVNDSIVLTDDLDKLYKNTSQSAVEATVDYNKIPEYKLLKQQIILTNYQKKATNYGYAPSLNAFITHQQNTFGQSFSNLGTIWYPGTFWGLNLTVPIFDGFRKSSQAQQSKISLNKAENDLKNLENGIQQQVFQSKTAFERAGQQLKLQERNLQLAEDINRRVNIKYKNGVGSTLEVTTSQNDLETARANYLSTVYDYFVAEIELRKATGNIN